jgi:hypothetical protein
MHPDEDEFTAYRHLSFMPTRVPALDALCTFVAADEEPQGPARVALGLVSSTRWYPQNGGHRVLTPYDGGEYDASVFTLEPGAWDHEHCSLCRVSIPSMTLFWFTTSGSWVALCVACKQKMDQPG